MIGDRAIGTDAACAHARIAALLVLAGLVERALVVLHALRPARRCRTDEARHTRAHRLAVVHATLAVRAARRRMAGVGDLVANAYRLAVDERIAFEAGRTAAHRNVREHLAVGVLGAGARTRIRAAVAHARLVARALGAEHALGSTADVRIAVEFGRTLADAGAAALGVRAAR